MRFQLIESLSSLSGFQWGLFIGLGVFVVVCIAYVFRRIKKEEAENKKGGNIRAKGVSARALALGAMCIALAFVLSYLRILHMPQGGSITLASMLPVIIYAYWYGPRNGFLAAVAYGLLQYIQDPYFLNFSQFALDYLIGFGVLGLAGLFRRNLALGAAVSGMARFLCSFLSGVFFFADYAAEAGQNVFVYSFLYNFTSIGVDTMICVIVALIPAVLHVIDRLRPSGAPKTRTAKAS